MKSINIVLIFMLMLIGTPVLASSIGSIKNVEGQAWISRGEKQLPAQAGARLLVDDVLKTGGDGAVGIILQDDTIISMGPLSEMVLADFLFQPEASQFAMMVKFFKGTFSYLSGSIGKLAPESVKIETPVGMVAVRGTHFLIKIGN
ncbi:MAG: FecR domain-containing protein [Desulforhopalus sp.]